MRNNVPLNEWLLSLPLKLCCWNAVGRSASFLDVNCSLPSHKRNLEQNKTKQKTHTYSFRKESIWLSKGIISELCSFPFVKNEQSTYSYMRSKSNFLKALHGQTVGWDVEDLGWCGVHFHWLLTNDHIKVIITHWDKISIFNMLQSWKETIKEIILSSPLLLPLETWPLVTNSSRDAKQPLALGNRVYWKENSGHQKYPLWSDPRYGMWWSINGNHKCQITEASAVPIIHLVTSIELPLDTLTSITMTIKKIQCLLGEGMLF